MLLRFSMDGVSHITKFDIPNEYENLDPCGFSLVRAPVLSVSDMSKPCSYEAFLAHPQFPIDGFGDPWSGWVMHDCHKAGRTCWFDIRTVQLAVTELGLQPTQRLSINIAPESAATPSFVENVIEIVGQNREVAERLTFEITEHGYDIANAYLVEFGVAMQSLGASFVLDDVGTGRFFFDKIDPALLDACDGVKLPRSLVSLGMKRDEKNGRLQKKIVHFSEQIYKAGKDITLEGIEGLGMLRSWVDKGLWFNLVQPTRSRSHIQRQVQEHLALNGQR